MILFVLSGTIVRPLEFMSISVFCHFFKSFNVNNLLFCIFADKA